MDEQRGSEIFSGLPQTRPQRRSEKRAPRTPLTPEAPEAEANPLAAAPENAAPEPEAASPEPSEAAPEPAKAAPVTVKPARPRASRSSAQKPARASATRATAPRATGGGATRAPAGGATRATGGGATGKPRRRIAQPAQPTGTPKQSEGRRPSSAPAERDPVTGVVRAAAEIAEVGLAIGTHALRRALSRLPRP